MVEKEKVAKDVWDEFWSRHNKGEIKIEDFWFKALETRMELMEVSSPLEMFMINKMNELTEIEKDIEGVLSLLNKERYDGKGKRMKWVEEVRWNVLGAESRLKSIQQKVRDLISSLTLPKQKKQLLRKSRLSMKFGD